MHATIVHIGLRASVTGVVMFVAPTEPKTLKDMVGGVVSPLPEEHGVDFMWGSELGKVGVQRKVFPGDFLSSIHDGRLNREYQLMKELDFAVLLLEGPQRWTSEGELISDRGSQLYRWTFQQHCGYLASVHLRGVCVAATGSQRDTYNYLNHLQVWSNKGNHSGLDQRPPATPQNPWGRITNVDYQSYLLQGLPGVGPGLAMAIIETIGFPLRFDASVEELMEVPGIGRKTAERIVRVFDGS